MHSVAKKAVSHAGIYALGNVLRNAVSIIMLPIYTRYLTPSDYGVIELLSMLIDFVSIFLGMRLGESIFRFYNTSTVDADRKTVISTSLFLSILLNGIGVIFVLLFAKQAALWVFGDASLENYVRLFSFTLLTQAFIEVPLVYIRAQQRPWVFVGFSLFKLILQLGLNIYFVVILKMHVEGVIYSALISGGIMAALLLIYTVSSVGMRISYQMTTKLMRFSVPLMLAALGAFYLTFGDRYFLRLFGEMSDVGIYALGYKFGFILTVLIWDPFEKIWASLRYQVHEQTDARRVFQRTFIFVSILMISAALGMSLFVKDLLVIMSDPQFHAAHAIVPIILLAYVIQAWTNYCSFGLLLAQKTIQITYGAAVAVAVITVAYVGLIPFFGVFGAAWATVVGFAARLIWVYQKSRLEYDMRLPWGRVYLLVGLAACVYMASLLAPEQIVLSVIVRTLLFMSFFVLFMLLPILPADEKHALIMVIRNPKRFKKMLAGSPS